MMKLLQKKRRRHDRWSMTDLSAEFKALANYRPTHKVRFVTAASLFDGHDAAINIMRRILQGMGAEVIHLGHNRSVDEVVTAALQEDVQGIAISSYQGGHVEYFKYMVDLLRQRGGAHIQVFGGGGGVIVPAEIRELQGYGVRIYSPEDGQRMGLQGMIGEMVMRCDQRPVAARAHRTLAALQGHGEAAWRALAQAITALENGKADAALVKAALAAAASREDPRAGHHRHRRRRQEQPHRRADPPPAPGPGRRAAHGGDQHRPQPAQERRRAAGRPHPHERHRAVEKRPARLHAQPGHARPAARSARPCPTWCRLQGGRVSTW
jgi:methylmalonyl-CoA mutase cobalamin-binding domain/chain